MTVAVPSAQASAAQACRSLLPRLPQTLGRGQRRRTTDPTRSAAWGNPPITLVCAAGPADLEQPPLILNGEAFNAVRTGQQILWTTRDRAVTVQLVIPRFYDDQAGIVLPLVPLLAELPKR